MLKIRAGGDRDRFILTIDGHADFGPRGMDIVCAGVAAIVEAALLGLERLSRAYPDHVAFKDQRQSDTSGQSLL